MTERRSPPLELVITRDFDAPRELVWAAWNDPEHAKRWGPAGFTTPVREMDLRPGGAWRAVMISPEGREYRQHGVVREVVPPERLAFTFAWDDHPEEEMYIEVTFAEHRGKTRMTFRQTGFASAHSRDGRSWRTPHDGQRRVPLPPVSSARSTSFCSSAACAARRPAAVVLPASTEASARSARSSDASASRVMRACRRAVTRHPPAGPRPASRPAVRAPTSGASPPSAPADRSPQPRPQPRPHPRPQP